jgi:RND family efflux transporter MFP subunit
MLSKIVTPVVIILVSIVAAVWMSAQQSTPETLPAAPPIFLVDVVAAKMSSQQITVRAQGTVIPRTETTLVSEVSGLITEVSPAFVAGGFFSKGDVLIRIDDRNYRAEVKRVQASVAAAQTQVTRETGLADYAEADWKRAKPLLSSSKAASDLALRKPQLAEAIANLDFAQAELDKREGDLDRTVIRAPYDGMVRQKRADIGQYVAAGTQLALTFAVDVAEVRLPLSDRELPFLELSNLRLDPASQPEVQLFAEIGGIEHIWKGRIVRTEGVFDERSRVLYVVAQVADPYNQLEKTWSTPLRFGTFVQANISGDRAENIIRLPRSVLQNNDAVWIVGDNSELTLQTVDLLRTDERWIYVRAGLDTGDLICITTLDNPLPGTIVRHGIPLQLASGINDNARN